MTFAETMESIKNFIDELEGREFLATMRDTFIKIIYEMERQFDFMENNDKKPMVDPLLIRDIFKTFEFIQERYMIDVITTKNLNFVKTYLLLIGNWNNNVACDQKIRDLVNFISNLYDNHLTVVHSFNILKELIKRCERLQGFGLPSVELSKHYLDSLDREIEGKK